MLTYAGVRQGISASAEALLAVEKLGGGDMRKSLNILQSAAMASEQVTRTHTHRHTHLTLTHTHTQFPASVTAEESVHRQSLRVYEALNY